MNVNQIELKNAVLAANTAQIQVGVMATAQGYLMIGEALAAIRADKLWADDFDSFADYCDKVLNIKQATAYRIIQTSQKFLAPEKDKSPSELIFTPFHDTALAALNPVGDYETTAEFIAENNITPSTTVSEIRKLVKHSREEANEDASEEAEPAESAEETESAEAEGADELNVLIQIVANAEQCRDKRKRKQRSELKTAIEKIVQILEL